MGINIKQLVEKDVQRVLTRAKIVLRISGGDVQKIHNPNPILNVIGIIGPSEAFGKKFESALLSEIGLWRTHPFSSAKIPYDLRRVGESYTIPYRRKWFRLTREQYRLVAPKIFSTLQSLVDEGTKKWDRTPQDGWKIETKRFQLIRRKKQVIEKTSYKAWPRGLRFSVLWRDEYIARDIFWAELNLNKELRNFLRKAAQYINLMMKDYRKKGYSQRSFDNLKGAINILKLARTATLQRYPYLWAEIFEKYITDQANLKGKGSLFLTELSQLVSWNGEEFKQRRLASLAGDDPKSRLNDIQLRFVRENEEYGYCVFEVFPRKMGKEESKSFL